MINPNNRLALLDNFLRLRNSQTLQALSKRQNLLLMMICFEASEGGRRVAKTLGNRQWKWQSDGGSWSKDWIHVHRMQITDDSILKRCLQSNQWDSWNRQEEQLWQIFTCQIWTGMPKKLMRSISVIMTMILKSSLFILKEGTTTNSQLHRVGFAKSLQRQF